MRILLIEDDIEICDPIKLQLNLAGFDVDLCHTGEDALFYALQRSYDAIVLDRMLPGMSGLDILLAIRKNLINTPVIMATAMDQISDRIDGLDAGADDYIVKPFDILELMARIRALTRRPAKIESLLKFSFLDLSLDVEQKVLSSSSKSISLSKRECVMMEFFMKNKEQTISRSILLAHVWGADSEVEEGNLDNYIHFLRKRLKSAECEVQIKTVHGVGYRLQGKDDSHD